MNILYLGDDAFGSTSLHRANSFRRLGFNVLHINPRNALISSKWISRIGVRFSFICFDHIIYEYLKKMIIISGLKFDFIWVTNCAELGPKCYILLKKLNTILIHYQNDDPFGGRDGMKWFGYVKSLKYFDCCVVVRDININEAISRGARKVIRVHMSYDKIEHMPATPTEKEFLEYTSKVAFVGSWMPERGKFLSDLLKLNVPLTLRGDRWNKASEWKKLKHCWKGPAVYGRNYVLSVQLSEVFLGLLSKGNRDQHTTRSLEVPYIGGGVLCAERTAEHMSMFEENYEIMMWDNVEECAQKCFELLENEDKRKQIAFNAKNKVVASSYSHDDVIRHVLTELGIPMP